jgi:hypothetical protein
VSTPGQADLPGEEGPMAITVVAGSAEMPVTRKPVLMIAKDDSSTNMLFNCHQIVGDKTLFMDLERPMKMTGRCKITGGPGDNPAGWTLGFIQLQWIETNWAYYQGEKDVDGSCLVRRDRPDARPAQGCRDTLAVGGILFDNNAGHDRFVAGSGSFPMNMTAAFSDAPNESYALTRVNSRTKKTNFLREVQLEFHFCTILALMDPDPGRQVRALLDLENAFQYLKHVFWNVHWQAKFLPTKFADVTAPWTITPSGGALGNGANVSRTFDGGPTDPRFLGNSAALAAPNCLLTAETARKKPNLTESLQWE